MINKELLACSMIRIRKTGKECQKKAVGEVHTRLIQKMAPRCLEWVKLSNR